MIEKLREWIFQLQFTPLARFIRHKWLLYQIKTKGVFIPRDYKTIQEALDANKKIIVLTPKHELL